MTLLMALSLADMAQSSPPSRDINAVLAANDRKLLALPHVVGVYVGVLEDRKTPCLTVMLSENDRATVKQIPSQLEGYAVVVKVSGEIRPLQR
jgi:hypothetical protein